MTPVKAVTYTALGIVLAKETSNILECSSGMFAEQLSVNTACDVPWSWEGRIFTLDIIGNKDS